MISCLLLKKLYFLRHRCSKWFQHWTTDISLNTVLILQNDLNSLTHSATGDIWLCNSPSQSNPKHFSEVSAPHFVHYHYPCQSLHHVSPDYCSMLSPLRFLVFVINFESLFHTPFENTIWSCHLMPKALYGFTLYSKKKKIYPPYLDLHYHKTDYFYSQKQW